MCAAKGLIAVGVASIATTASVTTVMNGDSSNRAVSAFSYIDNHNNNHNHNNSLQVREVRKGE